MPQAELLDSIFSDANDLFVIVRPDRTLHAANPAFRRAVRGAGDGVGVDFMDLVPLKAQERVLVELVKAAGGEEVLVEVPHSDADGRVTVVEYRFFPIDGGMVAGIGRPRGGRLSDREAIQRMQEELKSRRRMLEEIQLELTQVPFIDPVTGVWNRIQVFERLTSEWSRCERFASPLTLLLVDVPGLEAVRKQEGPAVADGALKAVARRLKATVRDHDIVGRSMGDQFVIVAVHSDFEGAMSLARRLHDAVTLDPVTVEQREMPITLHIGGATSRSEGVEILEDLFRVAEDALRDARTSAEQTKVAAETA